jgi:KDO2-lipid IV(A) lauroyltransferase
MADSAAATWREFAAPRHWPGWLVIGLWRAIAFLPLPLIAAIGGVFGQLLYALHASRRRIALANLGVCFPNLDARERRKLARAHFRAFVTAALALPVAWFGSERRLHRLARWVGKEHADAALASGRPVIFLVPHFVALDIGAMVLVSAVRAQLRADLVSMYRRPKGELFDYLIRKGRLRFGGRLVERREGIKPVLRELRRGTSFIYLPDQDPGRRGTVFAPFFGVPAATLTTLSRLAAMTNAIVVPLYTRILPGGRGFEVITRPPFAGFPSGDDAADAARMNVEIEQGVRMMPEQYFWVHKRFKTRPEGVPPIYE